jgi:hypothetical protein
MLYCCGLADLVCRRRQSATASNYIGDPNKDGLFGQINHLDRHPISCQSVAQLATPSAMTGFWLNATASARSMRYEYVCCSAAGLRAAELDGPLYTDFKTSENGWVDIRPLAKHSVDCGRSNKVLAGFQLQAQHLPDKIRYQYTCRGLIPGAKLECESSRTKVVSSPNGSFAALYDPGLVVECPLKRVLSQFQLLVRDSGKAVQYQFSCCIVRPPS